MISLTRSLARQVRAVFRRAGIRSHNGLNKPISIQAGPDGLRLCAMTPDIAIEYQQAGECPADELTLPVSFLDDCQGKRDELVTLAAVNNKRIAVTWQDRGIPQSVRYDADRLRQSFPEPPVIFTAVEPTFWQALRDAAHCTDESPSRYALNNVHLRGEGGLVTVTDGRQLFQQGGFSFPWIGDVMIPRLAVLGCTELERLTPIEIGKTEKSLALRLGNWTLLVTIDTVGRYPQFAEILAQAESGSTVLQLPGTDAAFLADTLPRLPTSEFEECGVTLDLNGEACVRAHGPEGGPMTELVMSGATVTGEPLRIETNRQYLLTAMTLGMTEIRLSAPEAVLVASDGRRKYLWMPLSPQNALGPSADASRIDSAVAATEVSRPPSKSKTRRRSAMSELSTTSNGAAESAATTSGCQPAGGSQPAANAGAVTNEETPTAVQVRRSRLRKTSRQAAVGPIEQAVAVRDSLRESVVKANELIRTLKRQRQQSRLVATTLASLKQLQQAG